MRKKHRALKIVSSVAVIAALLSLGILTFLYFYAKKNINYEADEILFARSQSWEPTVFYAAKNKTDTVDDNVQFEKIEQIGGVRRQISSICDMPPLLINGFLSVEDQRFFEHRGVDYKRTALAALNYLFGSGKKFGASTVTQQVIKNISGDNQQTLSRKLNEILRAIHVEQKYSKEEILELYLNIVPMGNNHFGVGTAAYAYFGKELEDLTAAEVATLVGVANAPSLYNPYKNGDACINKRNKILSVMQSCGVISDTEYQSAVSSALSLVPLENRGSYINSWFVETCVSDLCADISRKYSISESAAMLMLQGGGYSVYTTMDYELQSKLEGYFGNTDNLPSEVGDGLNYSMAIIDSHTGDLVGIIGGAGRKSANRLFNHATALHSPASSLKPLAIYAPLLDNGYINWSTVVDDTPEYVSTGSSYPRNSPDIYSGLITVSDAIRLSKNTVAVKLANKFGVRAIFDNLKENYGFSTLVDSRTDKDGRRLTDVAISPMALGQLTDGISLLSLTEAYSAFAGDGIMRGGRTYYCVKDSDGRTVLDNPSSEKRVMKESTARIMNQLLKTVTESGTAKDVTVKRKIDTAGKTGTSSGSLDKLFVGYTPYYVAGIWCGYDGNRCGVGALSKSHIQIWDEIMLMLHSEIIERGNAETFSTDGLVYRGYCMDSGGVFSNNCKYDPRGNRQEYGYFTPDNAPAVHCSRHIAVDYDSVAKGVADPTCPKENRVKVALLYIPERSFIRQIKITDAEFVYREVPENVPRPSDSNLPYFIYALPDGEYSGVAGNKKHFNSAGKVYE